MSISGEWRRWREFRLFTGTLLFLVIAAPWHLLAGIRNPHFFWFYFVNEHFMRFLGKRIPKDYNKQTVRSTGRFIWYGCFHGVCICRWPCGGR